MSYDYSIETTMARYTNWDVLVRQIMENLNILEDHLSMSNTQLYSLDAGPPKIFSWLAKNGVDIQDRINDVRSGIGFDVFEWRAGFSPTSGTEYMSFDDLAMVARAVGVPGTRIPRAGDDFPYPYHEAGKIATSGEAWRMQYRTTPSNITTKDGAPVFDILLQLQSETFEQSLPASEDISTLFSVIPGGVWLGATGFNNLRTAFAFNIESGQYGSEGGYSKNAPSSPRVWFPFAQGRPTNPAEALQGGPVRHYKRSGFPSVNDEHTVFNPNIDVFTFGDTFTKEPHYDDYLGDFGEYLLYDPVVGDAIYSPQIAFMTNISNGTTLQWTTQINHISKHYLSDGIDVMDQLFRIASFTEGNFTNPDLSAKYSPDGNSFVALGDISGEGAGSVVADWTQTTTQYYFGCIPSETGLTLPLNNAIPPLSEILKYGNTPNTVGQEEDNGEIVNHISIYAESEFTPPLIWMASRR